VPFLELSIQRTSSLLEHSLTKYAAATPRGTMKMSPSTIQMNPSHMTPKNLLMVKLMILPLAKTQISFWPLGIVE